MTRSRAAESSRKAGYLVKNHGHRFFYTSVVRDLMTGEMYLPEETKFVQFVCQDTTEADRVWVVLKDELHG
jgi:hypothetical protein